MNAYSFFLVGVQMFIGLLVYWFPRSHVPAWERISV